MATIKYIFLLLILVSCNVFSEGSYELRGKTNANDEVRIESKRDNYDPSYTLGLGRVTIFYIDIMDSENEVIDLYTSNPQRVTETRDIAVWCPNNKPVNPEAGNSFASANRVFDVINGGNGFIGSWNDTVNIQNFNTRPRSPVTFDPQSEGCGEGVYTVRFFSHATNNSRSFANGISYVDMMVRDKRNNVFNRGRVFSRHYSLIQNGFGAELNFNLFVVQGEDNLDSYEGYVWEIDANGVQPFSFQLVANSNGASPNIHNDNSISLNSTPTPSMLDEYNIYLNYPDKTVFLPPSQPNVTNFFYHNVCPDDNDENGYTEGGYFNFYSNGNWKYKLYIDLDSDGEVTLNEKVFQGNATSGLNRVYWDGVLPDGSTMPNGTNVKFNLYLSDGEVHFPFVDVENRGFETGPVFTLLNTSTSDSNYYYWNDVLLSGGNSTSMDGTLSIHTWVNDLGNGAIIDTFKYAYNDGLEKNIIYGGECSTPDLGGNVSGYVFDDLNHNGSKDAEEEGIKDVTIVLHNITNNDCETQRTDSNGYFLFDNILVSEFNLVESANETLPISYKCPPEEEDPSGYISVDSNTKKVIFNELNASYLTFANYKGYKVEGRTFFDNGGDNDNNAHNGNVDSGEMGFRNIKLKAQKTNGEKIKEVYSNGNGEFEIWLRSENNNIDILAEDKLNHLNISSSTSIQNSSTSNENKIELRNISIGKYGYLNFGYIQEPSLNASRTQTIQGGTTTYFGHKYRANSSGQVSFYIDNEQLTPNDINASSILYYDVNCNENVDDNDIRNPENISVGLNSNSDICLLVKVFTPKNAPNNSSYSFDIIAITNHLDSSKISSNKIQDLTIITDYENNSSLLLTKVVDKISALPNEEIEYTVTAKNNGNEKLNNIIINDYTPNFTNFVSAECPQEKPSGITSCSVIEKPEINKKGNVKWSFIGDLYTNEEIKVVYKVKVDG